MKTGKKAVDTKIFAEQYGGRCMNKIKYGVIGLNVGLGHIRTILKNPQADLLAVCDPDEKRLEDAKQLLISLNQDISNVRFLKKFDDVLRVKDIDAVVIALPSPLHVDFSIRAMESGKHVLCEKPISESMESAHRLCDYVDKTDRVFQIAYCVRSSALHQKCMDIIKSGVIGDVVLVWWNMFCCYLDQGWRADRKLGGGKLFDCACHYVDIISLWAGAGAERVCAFGNPKGEKGINSDKIPEVSNVIIEYENAVKGTYNLSQVTSVPNVSVFGIVGTNGRIDGEPYYPDGAGSLVVYSDNCLFKHQIDINGEKNSRGHLGFDEQYNVFLDAIFEKKAVACSAHEAREVLRVMEAIDHSIASGTVVKIS